MDECFGRFHFRFIQFLWKIFAKFFFRDLFSDKHRYDDRFSILKLILRGVGYVGGVMPCIVLVDTVIYPYNVVKQSVRLISIIIRILNYDTIFNNIYYYYIFLSDVKLLKKKGGSRRSQLSAILKSLASTPIKTFLRFFKHIMSIIICLMILINNASMP